MKKIYIYHNLKPFIQIPYEDHEKVSDSLIRSGFSKGKSLPEQISTYETFIEEIQKIKKYKVSDPDQQMYIACILALYKLKRIDPDDSESPFWISPSKKKVRKLKK